MNFPDDVSSSKSIHLRQKKNINFLEELLASSDCYDETSDDQFIDESPVAIDKQQERIEKNGAEYSDRFLDRISRNLLKHAKVKRVAELIVEALAKSSVTMHCRIAELSVKEWHVLCTHKNATKVAQYLVEISTPSMVQLILEGYRESAVPIVKDIYGFYCTMKLLPCLSNAQHNVLFSFLLIDSKFWKTKNCYLVMSKIIENGVSPKLAQIFMESTEEIGGTANRNVLRLRNQILKAKFNC